MCLFSGSTKHSITLSSQDEGKGSTVKDLSDAVCQATGVPPASQKLIFKGKHFIFYFHFTAKWATINVWNWMSLNQRMSIILGRSPTTFNNNIKCYKFGAYVWQ